MPWSAAYGTRADIVSAGVLVLEALEHAQARGAPILAELVGGAIGSDAYHLTDPRPDGSGVRACIERALQTTGIAAADVNYVNAHATSTSAGDLAEYRCVVPLKVAFAAGNSNTAECQRRRE